MNVQSDILPRLTPEQDREVKSLGYAHFRHADCDTVKSLALLRAAAVVISDVAADSRDPNATLALMVGELRAEAKRLLDLAQDADKPLNVLETHSGREGRPTGEPK